MELPIYAICILFIQEIGLVTVIAHPGSGHRAVALANLTVAKIPVSLSLSVQSGFIIQNRSFSTGA
jgi:alpha-D-ribose 1-methylphosphonate 5-triphosphate synthase subunit PhnG